MAKNPPQQRDAVDPVPPADATGPAPITDAGRVLFPDAARPTVEEPVAEVGADGEPRSASIEPRQASPIEAALGRPLRHSRAPAEDPRLAAVLPARTRVLASGVEVPARPAAAMSSEERVFTATARILRGKKLYEVGAPVPLNRAEFRSKRRIGAVQEEEFDDGEDAEIAAALAPA